MKTYVKKIILSALLMIGFSCAYAAAPQGISYQASAKDQYSQPLKNTAIDIDVAVLDGSYNVIYSEKHSVMTNVNGTFNFVLGEGMFASGQFSNIDWSNGDLSVRLTAENNNFFVSGASPLLAVPYALYADTTNNAPTPKGTSSGDILVGGNNNEWNLLHTPRSSSRANTTLRIKNTSPTWVNSSFSTDDDTVQPEVTFDGATVESIEGQLIQGMEYVIDFREHKYQYQRNFNVDVFAGYLSLCMDYDGRQPSTYYYPNNPFINGPYGETPKLYPYIAPAISAASGLGRGDLAAIAKIMFAYSMLAIADCNGPIAYYDWRVLKETYPLHYLSPREAYGAIIQDLRDAVDTLNVYQPTVAQLKRVEGSTAGSPCGWMWQNWVKFANSIQLRMALNMANVKEPIQLYRDGLDNPTTAEMPQQIAEKAVAAGVLEYGDDDIGFKSKERNLVHPLYKISVGWEDTRLSASLENIAKRYQHPMLEYYFINNGAGKHGYDLKDKNNAALTTLLKNSMRLGVRQGIMLKPQSQSKNDYLTFSEVSTNVQYLNFTWIKVAEVVFLQAEGALRGWNMGGTAQSFYEDGISIGFEEIGATAELARYMNQETVLPIDYVDYYDRENNIPGRVTVGVKWNDADDNEVKLEKIITQKWFANFPMSLEAWTTFRRTGYPRLFPVKINQWNYEGKPDNEIQIRRIPWPDPGTAYYYVNFIDSSYALNYYNLLNAACKDNGLNWANSPLFWDISDSWSKDPEGKVIPVNF